MDARKRTAFLLGLAGLVLLVLGVKALPGWLAAAAEQPVTAENQPVLLFFNDTDPCECMQELVRSADRQMADWQNGAAGNIQVMRIGMQKRADLEAKYKVFRAPCLVLVDGEGEAVWRQDYPMIEGGPFKLDELETAISSLKAE